MNKKEIEQELENIGIDGDALKNLGSIKTKINHDTYNYKQKLEYQKKKKRKSRSNNKRAKQSRKNNR